MFAKKESADAALAALFEGEEFVEGGCLYCQRFGVIDVFEILVNEHAMEK